MTPRPDTGSLAALLAQATPGPWIVQKEPPWIAGSIGYDDARLIALAPDMARLLVDMAEALRNREGGVIREEDALLARFAEIERRAAQ